MQNSKAKNCTRNLNPPEPKQLKLNNMKKNVLILIVICLNLLLFQNCKTDNQEKKQTETISKVKESDTIEIENKEDKITNYSIEVEVIDSLKYNSIKRNSKVLEKNLIKITNINEAKKILNGIVEFDENKDFGENPAVKKIFFRNGKKYQNNNEFDYYFFIAYFPEEDILLCEGGHSTDVSFNLKNGKETEEAGNPDLFIFSPNNKFRLNGSYDGQECNGYFLQVEKNKNFEKIINLEQEVKRQTKISICNIRDGFWSNNNTLYLEKYDFDFEHNKYKYIKIEIIEK